MISDQKQVCTRQFRHPIFIFRVWRRGSDGLRSDPGGHQPSICILSYSICQKKSEILNFSALQTNFPVPQDLLELRTCSTHQFYTLPKYEVSSSLPTYFFHEKTIKNGCSLKGEKGSASLALQCGLPSVTDRRENALKKQVRVEVDTSYFDRM